MRTLWLTMRLRLGAWIAGRPMAGRDPEADAVEQATPDPLTGLADRRTFGEALERALGRAPEGVAILFLDVDDLKTFNDTYGRDEGDMLISVVGFRIQGALRGADLAARLGGDEFAVLLADSVQPDGALAVAERIRRSLQQPIRFHGRMATAQASVGIALGSAGAEADELMRNADIALHAAKDQGRGMVETFQPTMRADVERRQALRSGLAAALNDRELTVHYQPIRELRGGRVAAVEALVRWRHPDHGLILPREFIGAAEESGLMGPLGRLVLETACRDVQGWRASVPKATDLSLSVNVATSQLRDPAFADEVTSILERFGLPASALILELVESASVAGAAAAATMRKLSARGIRLAIDDLGSGNTAMVYLTTYPIDIVKLDDSLVAALGKRQRDTALIEATVRLAKRLRLLTVAEGVEDERQLGRLRAMGCDLGQGYLLGRPVAADEVARAIASRPARSRSATRRGEPVLH